METSQKPKGLFYGWVIVAAGCLVMAVVMGIVYNCFSQFIKPVCEDLGFTRQAMSMNQTFLSLTQIGVALVWGRVLAGFGKKLDKLMLFWAVVGPIAYYCFSFATQIWVFYIISVIMSIVMNMVTTLPLSYILSNWFEEKRGLATGICFMGSGIGGMILNPLLGRWLEQYGWRMSFRILAVVMAVVAIPCVMLIRVRPEDKGLKPLDYRERPSGETTGTEVMGGSTLAEAKRMPKFWLLVLCGMMMTMGNSTIVQTLSPHLTDSGYSTAFAAAMVSIGMGALALGKVVLGQMFDKLGTRTTALIAAAMGLVGLTGMIFCRRSYLFVCMIFLGIGFACSYGSVGNTIIIQNIFGRKDFSAILGLYTAFVGVGGSISPMVNGASVDRFGSYRPAFMLWMCLLVFVIVCYGIILPGKNKKQAD